MCHINLPFVFQVVMVYSVIEMDGLLHKTMCTLSQFFVHFINGAL